MKYKSKVLQEITSDLLKKKSTAEIKRMLKIRKNNEEDKHDYFPFSLDELTAELARRKK